MVLPQKCYSLSELLNEAASHFDIHKETWIQQTLSKFPLLLVAHNLSIVTLSDQIFVLEKGRVIEEGSHQTLLNLGRKYATSWQLQEGEKLVRAVI